MEKFYGVSEVQRKEIEQDTLAAIAEGQAMPLPDFLNESSEARKAFLGALDKSQELRASLSELTPDEKSKLLTAFSEVLNKPEATTLESVATILVSSLGAVGATLSVVGYASGNTGLLITGCSTLLATINLIMSGSAMDKLSTEQRESLKKHILQVVAA